MKLSEMTVGETARIIAVVGGTETARLAALGVAPGAETRCLFCHPSGDPVAYLFGETVVAMRRCTADAVLVESKRKNREEP